MLDKQIVSCYYSPTNVEHKKYFKRKMKQVQEKRLTCFRRSSIMKMYKVVAKCGHVGKGHYVEKVFAVKAKDGKDAAEKVRRFPRVKHHHKDAIRSVDLISIGEYMAIQEEQEKDPFFFCKNIQDQRAYYEENIMDEPEGFFKEKEISRKPVFVGKKRLRNPRKYITVNQIYNDMRYAI